MNRVYVRSVGLAAPGLANWSEARAVLRGEADHVVEGPMKFVPAVLPANERRRTSTTIKLALQVAQEAMQGAGAALDAPACVFASCSGDMDIVHNICTALTQPGKPVSPTQFHNSVHNAPAGYWSIAAKSPSASTSLSAYDGSFAAGLIEALTQVAVEGHPVLLIAYDVRPPEPLFASRPVGHPFGTALLLEANAGAGALAGIDIEIRDAAPEALMDAPSLEALRMDSAPARSLPLLARLAAGRSGEVLLPYLPGSVLAVGVASLD